MTNKYDAIVLGTGGVGSSALFHLSKRSGNVLGLDRFPGGHDRGSSHGETRIIRQAYFEHPDYVPLLLRAYELWHELELTCKKQLLYQPGLLEIGYNGGMLIKGVLDAASQHQLSVDEISTDEMKKKFPGYILPEGYEALFEPAAGYLLVEQCILAYLSEAEKSGAEIRSDEEVLRWDMNDTGLVTVHTNQNSYEAERLIITSGAWSGDLLKELGLNLRIHRKHLHWYSCNDNSPYHEQKGGPTFFYETEDGCFYGFPVCNERGLKISEHTGGELVSDPLQLDRSIDITDRNRVEKFLSDHLPGVSLKSVDHQTCMYTLSPDEHFIVDTHPEFPQVVYAAGLSGHGFKFASVLGEVLSDLAFDGKTHSAVEFLKRR